jgi:hypothetical protein
LVGCALLVERSLSWDDSATEVPPAPEGQSSRAAAPSPRSTADRDALARLRLEKLEARQRALEARVDPPASSRPLFGRVSWAPPAPPAAVAPPPPPPVAPPFPYAYLGSLVEDGVQTVFFNKGERVLTLKTGDTVDGAYRVDSMNDRQMVLTYLPLGQSLAVPFGAAR